MKVHRYKSPSDIVTYNIQIPIFPDDTVSKVITKIAIDIRRQDSDIDLTSQPYIWWKNTALGFEITPKPASANPWVQSVPPESYNITRFAENIWNPHHEMNILFVNDATAKLRVHPAFFPDAAVGQAWKLGTTYDLLLKETAALDQVWQAGEGPSPDIHYSRVTFLGDVVKHVDLSEIYLYTSVKPTTDVPYVQLIFDEIKILYKIAKKRKRQISAELFGQFTALDRIPKIQGLVALVPMKYHENNRQAYARVVLDISGKIAIHYKIDHSIKVSLQDFAAVNAMILNWLRVKVSLRVSSLSARTMISDMRNTSSGIDGLRATISKMGQVFYIEKAKPGAVNSIEAIYKRSVNYKSDLDVVDSIRSQFDTGLVSEQEIKENLVNNMGMTAEEARRYMDEYWAHVQAEQQGEKPVKRKHVSTGCIIRITTAFKLGFNIHIENVGSVEEFHNAIRWLKGVIARLPSKKPVVTRLSSSSESPPASSSSSSAQPNHSPSPSPESAASSFSFGSDSSSSGGAIGKNYNGYFLQRLTERDKTLFTPGPGEKAYPTLCSVTNARQPIAVTPEEMNTIQQKGYATGIPDSLEYRGNHYFCPLLWCPKEGIPVTPGQLIDVNGTKVCPGPHSEEPIDLRDPYFAKGNTFEKHISFINSKWKSGLCLPCCAKKAWIGKPQFEEKIRECKAGPVQRLSVSKSKSRPPSGPGTAAPEPAQGRQNPGPSTRPASSSAAPPVDQTNFIKKAAPPIPIGRVGTIPEDLHNIMIPSVSYDKCATSLTTIPCLVRFGIDHGDDSIMNAVAKCLQKDKSSLLSLIKKHMDPLTFMSLDNGNVVQMYLPIAEDPVDEGAIKQARQWLDKHPTAAALWKTDGIAQRSRLAVVYRSYLNFISFLASDAQKSAALVIEIVAACLNTTLLIFEKTGGDTADMYCPKNMRTADKIIIVLKEEQYFEPLVLKARNRDPKSVFTPEDFTGKIMSLLTNSCDKSYRVLIGMIRGLKQWIDGTLVSTGYLALHSVIIRPDLSIHGFMTRGKIMILCDSALPLSILPEIVRVLGLKSVIFLEDHAFADSDKVIELPESDLRRLGQKLESMSMKIVSGDSRNAQHVFHSYYPALRVGSILPRLRDQDRRWHHIKSAVLQIIITYYDTLVEPLNVRPPKEQRTVLVQTFRGLIKPGTPGADSREAIVYHVLEQMPLREGLHAILRWKRMGYADPIWTSSGIYDKKTYWEFTQIAVEEGIPQYVISNETETKEAQAHNYVPAHPTDANPPAFIADREGTQLPSKWRHGSFADFKMLKNAYQQDSLSQMTSWLSERTVIPVSWSEVRYVAETQLIRRLSNKDARAPLLSDTSVLTFLRTRLNPLKQLKNAAEVGATLETVSRDTLVRVFSASATALWPCDIHLLAISKLLDISIFLIGRAAYNSNKQDTARAGLQDRVVSSSLFTGSKAWRERPIIFMFKASASTNSDHTVYHTVLSNTGTFFHQNYNNLAEDVKKVIDAVFDTSAA